MVKTWFKTRSSEKESDGTAPVHSQLMTGIRTVIKVTDDNKAEQIISGVIGKLRQQAIHAKPSSARVVY